VGRLADREEVRERLRLLAAALLAAAPHEKTWLRGLTAIPSWSDPGSPDPNAPDLSLPRAFLVESAQITPRAGSQALSLGGMHRLSAQRIVGWSDDGPDQMRRVRVHPRVDVHGLPCLRPMPGLRVQEGTSHQESGRLPEMPGALLFRLRALPCVRFDAVDRLIAVHLRAPH